MSMFFEAEPSDGTATRSGTSHRGRPWLIFLLVVAALVVVGALVAAALYVVSVDRAVNQNLQRGTEQLPAETPTAQGEEPRPPKTDGKAVNYVLLGSDSRVKTDAGRGR